MGLGLLVGSCTTADFLVIDGAIIDGDIHDGAPHDGADAANLCELGAPCDDGNACTENDSCATEGCSGQHLLCDEERQRCEGAIRIREWQTGICDAEMGCITETETRQCAYGCAEGTCSPCLPSTWYPAHIHLDDDYAPSAHLIDMAVGPDGSEHVAFIDQAVAGLDTNRSAIYYGHRRDPSEPWEQELVFPHSPSVDHPQIRLRQGRPVILFRQHASFGASDNLNHLLLKEIDGSWRHVEVPGYSHERSATLAIDSHDAVHVLRHHDELLSHLTFDGTDWVNTPLQDARLVTSIDMTTDAAGTLHAIWSSDEEIWYGTYDGTEWQTARWALPSRVTVAPLSIALGPDGYPHILYHLSGNGLLYHIRFVDGVWSPARVVGPRTRHGDANDIAIDPSGGVHIVFRDQMTRWVNYAYAPRPTADFTVSVLAYEHGDSLSLWSGEDDLRLVLRHEEATNNSLVYYARRPCP